MLTPPENLGAPRANFKLTATGKTLMGFHIRVSLEIK